MPDISRTWTSPGSPVVSVYQSKSGVIVRQLPAATSSSGSVVRSGLVTAGYWKKRLTGDLPDNRFRFQEVFTSASYGRELMIDSNPFNPSVELSVGSLGFSNPFVEPFNLDLVQHNQENLVVARIASKVKDTSVDISVVAGELRETRRMFVGIADSVRRAIGFARKGKFASAASALGMKPKARSAANGWLLLNYGILPLISDLKGSIKALEKGLMKERYCLVSARDVLDDSVTHASGEYTTRWTYTSEVSARVKYRISNPYTATLASLGLSNPFSTAWELTKLSFVVDWLVGVGAWLNQIAASRNERTCSR